MSPGAVAVLTLAASLQPQPTFRTGVEIVRIDVSVMRDGVPVRGLTGADFDVRDNGVRQNVDSVTVEEVPLSVVMVLDVSSSVQGERLQRLIEAGQALVRSLRPRERAALLTFSHAVSVKVPLTNDLARLIDALSSVKGSGATSVRDAVHLGLQLAPVDGTRPIVLLFTDGADTASWLSEIAVVDSARRANVVLHAIEIRPPLQEASDFLDRLASVTGGRLWSASSNRELRELFTKALEEMRARYLLSYAPEGVKREGWHDLKVSLKGQRADVTSRPGYFVGASTADSRR